MRAWDDGHLGLVETCDVSKAVTVEISDDRRPNSRADNSRCLKPPSSCSEIDRNRRLGRIRVITACYDIQVAVAIEVTNGERAQTKRWL